MAWRSLPAGTGVWVVNTTWARTAAGATNARQKAVVEDSLLAERRWAIFAVDASVRQRGVGRGGFGHVEPTGRFAVVAQRRRAAGRDHEGVDRGPAGLRRDDTGAPERVARAALTRGGAVLGTQQRYY